ncbi:LrgB family protein [Priestia endophytica]|mgnify:CR=1 FL=1|jgi:predicted murein hydrolase (TIGR00659 family)|uniref:CidB/LrgB family autolysis modulator n=2 Tax=Priestia endophytica TaxID=135735 RepID=A0AAX1Q2R4_9BACI|nr:LrgB family protein [Priestia endophytica]KYG31396.1 CidB/LrgB family autolysis modulator [Priestia endophytica]MBG9811736.1 LrgB [Priestia endophytica]MCM3536828.1 LrgB family protein [Priestia endophytica]RAS72148.1 CidB/LrgB family autolysis modulator [Priestia endophytica]RAS74026.1 CidB/LrgB family autolysis modulator [Priestia endophytica]
MSGLIIASAIVGTLAAYMLSKVLYKRFKTIIFSPIVLAPVILIGTLVIGDIPYTSYKEGADSISYLLGPATVAFAVPIYKNLHLLKKHGVEIILSVASGTMIAMFSSLLLAFLFHFDHLLTNSLVPRSITIPIAVNVSQTLGGDPSLTILFVIITGIVGAYAGPKLIKLLTLRSSVARGLLLGVSAHGTGTARAFEFGTLEGTFSSLAMIMTALLTLLISTALLPFLL